MARVAPAQECAPTGQAEATPTRTPILPRSDELLARLVASGGERPFRALYERYHAPLHRYCYSILRNEADAQDALQSTFTRALLALRAGKRNAPLRPWLYRIAHNESISVLRARPPAQPDTDLEPVARSVEEVAEERARLTLLLSDLSQLAERARAALVMRELGGLSHEEIAVALGISAGAAKQAIFEARSALFELAQGRAMACAEVRRRLSDGDRRVLRGRQLRAHLRDCAACAAFAAAIPSRQADLRALSPVLPPAVAAAVLTRTLQGAAGHGGNAAVGSSAATAASGGSSVAGAGGAGAAANPIAASAAKALAAIATPKALLATAVIAGAAVGAGGLVGGASSHHERATRHGAAAAPRSVTAAPASHAARARHSQPAHGLPHDRSPSAAAHRPPPGVPPAHAKPSSSPGNSANAPGHSGKRPGNSANAPGHNGTSPGNSGNAPGRTGRTPGNSSSASSRTATPPGQALNHRAPSRPSHARGNPHAR